MVLFKGKQIFLVFSNENYKYFIGTIIGTIITEEKNQLYCVYKTIYLERKSNKMGGRERQRGWE